MSLAELSVKRPIFITCIAFIVVVLGLMSMSRIPVDLFPNVSFPYVVVTTTYPGAGPNEIENLVSHYIEDEMSTISGLKNLYSINKEGVSTVIAEFELETDVKFAEQEVRDRVATAKINLPKDIDEPIIRRIDPADQPVSILSIAADLPEAELFDLADRTIRPRMEHIPQVGLVEVIGGRKREIRVELDRAKLKAHEISVTAVANRLQSSGQNIPAGRIEGGTKETVFRTLGEYTQLKDIGSQLVNFFGNEVPIRIGDLGNVVDSLETEKTRVYTNGKKSIFVEIFRQTGANTIAVVDHIKSTVQKLNSEFKNSGKKIEVELVQDGARPIRANVEDVKESIFIGILLTFIVVYFFLGNFRSTLITGLALPYSLIGAFILMGAAGFTVNLMTLLAISLTVGLVIDDAIVVRENIFRNVELGLDAKKAALVGTREVSLAVIATTLTVLAVFGPIGFIKGMVGQFFREFGLTVCFAMLISLFDAFTMAPMLSAYYAGNIKRDHKSSDRKGFSILRCFEGFQVKMSEAYERILRNYVLKHPLLTLGFVALVVVGSFLSLSVVPKTFLPTSDVGEFSVKIDLPPGTSLDGMTELATKIDSIIRSNPEVTSSVMIIGNGDGESNVAQYFIHLVPKKLRSLNTSQVKEKLRQEFKPYAYANPKVQDIDIVGGGDRPFNLNLIGNNLDQLQAFSMKVLQRLKNHPGLKDVDVNFRPGKPEVQVVVDDRAAEEVGVSKVLLGQELRAQVEGVVPAKFRENGREYDVRVRLKDDQRDLRRNFEKIFVPNINQTLIRLSQVAQLKEATGPSTINRQNRSRYMQISADLAPDGPGIGNVIRDIQHMFATDLPVPPGISYKFVGQAENFQELMGNMFLAAGLGIVFIYLILSSLYESFITPFTLMLVLPACCGAFYALAITRKSLDLFSMIGCVMLLGVAMKNSILLVDYTHQMLDEGKSRLDAIVEAGKVRLRPILMTTVALIAGMLPIALGLNEASRQRTSMGVAIIGGLISATLLSLLVVPAAFSYIDRFKYWFRSRLKSVFWNSEAETESNDRVSDIESGRRRGS